MKIIRHLDLEWDYFSYWKEKQQAIVSVRTSEYDDYGRCKYQNLELDEEAEKLFKSIEKWIDKNLK